jgi:Xaa-Pro aminopeptidase
MPAAETLAALDRERWRRVFDAVARPPGAKALDGLLLTHVGDVSSVAGYAPLIERGQSPFAWLDPVALLWPDDGLLIVPDQEEGGARATNLLPGLASYPGYVYETPFDHRQRLGELIANALAAHLPRGGGNIGIQPETLPAGLAGEVATAFPRLGLVDVTARLAWARAVKDEAEIARLRHAFEVADAMHAEIRRILRREAAAGLTEIELYSAAKAAGERRAGERIALHADLLAGPRTAETGGNPGSRVIRDGDLVMADLAPRVDGYWADTCSATVVGAPSEEQQRVSGIVRSVLERGIERAQPGTPAADLDRFLRKEMRRAGFAYPHHSGHGVGATFHDEPRIVPYEQRPLAEGMVICLEPGAYVAGWGGIRWEIGLVVRAGGPEVLSHFALELDAAD